MGPPAVMMITPTMKRHYGGIQLRLCVASNNSKGIIIIKCIFNLTLWGLSRNDVMRGVIIDLRGLINLCYQQDLAVF